MKRMIGGIIMILFVLPGFVNAVYQGSVGAIVFSLMLIAGGGAMVYFGSKHIRRCKAESINRVNISQSAVSQTPVKSTQPTPSPSCNSDELEVNCPHCNQILEVPAEILGQVAECPSCNRSIQLPSAQPKTPPQPALEKADSAEPLTDGGLGLNNKLRGENPQIENRKEEECCACGSKLIFSNRQWRGYGLLKDEGEICISCTNKMQTLVGAFKFNPKNFTKAEVIDRIQLASAQPQLPPQQPATDPLIEKQGTVKPLKEEKCCACGSRLTFLTRNFGKLGILNDGREICISCTGKMRSTVGSFKYKPGNFTNAEVIDHILEFDKTREENARQKQNEKIARQSEIDAETRKVQDQIQNAKSYSVEYLGGVPGVEPEKHIDICATPSGIYAFKKEGFSKNMKELFLIEWKYISGISHSSTTKGSDATKNALLTAGFVKDSGIAILGGVLCRGQKTEEHIAITCKDDTSYESEILFQSTYQSQEIVLYLNTQRAVLYKPEKTPAMQIAVENPATVVDSIEQLKKLAELKNTGVITEEEFEKKKAEILTRI